MADKALYDLLINLKADTADLQRNMDKAVGILDKATSKMGSVARGFFEGFGKSLADGLTNTLTHPIQSIQKLDDALVSLADRGDKMGAIADNFAKLGGSSEAVRRAQDAVLGTVSAFDLMKVANEGAIRGLPDMNKNLALLSEYANRFADASGRDTVEVMNALVQAISKGSNKALAEFGITVSDTGTKSEKMAQAVAQLSANMEKLAPLGDSVTASHEAFSAALGDAISKVGIGINNNMELAGVYRELSVAINSIDWEQVGTNVASMVASIANALPSLQTVVDQVNNIAAAFRFVTGNSTQLEKLNVAANDTASEISDLRKEIEARKTGSLGNRSILAGKGGQWLDSVLGTELSGYSPAVTADLEKQLAEKQASLLEVGKEIARQQQKASLPANQGMFPADPRTMGMQFNSKTGQWGFGAMSSFGTGTGGGGGGGKNAIQQLKDQWDELQEKVKTESLKKAIESTVDTVNKQAFAPLKDQLQKQIADAWVEGHKKFLKAGVSMDELRAMGEKEAQAQVEEYQKKMDSAATTQAEKLADAQLKAQEANRQKNEQMWSDVFSSAFEKLGLDPRLADVAGKFANAFMDGLGGKTGTGEGGAAGLGQMFGKGLSDIFGSFFAKDTFNMSTDEVHASGVQGPGQANGLFGNAAGIAGQFLGSGMSTDQAHEAGIAGPGLQNGSFGGGGSSSGLSSSGMWGEVIKTIPSLIETWTSDTGLIGRQDTKKKIEDSIHTVGMAVANYWTLGLASLVEKAIGRENMEKLSIGKRIIEALFSENAETTARKAFDRWIEGALKDKHFSILDKDGKPTRFSGNFETQKFTETFSKPGWADDYTKSKGFKVFDALGQSFKDLLGITEDIGGQIGFILSENLNGNVNNARRLVKALGLSFEDFEKKLVEVGLKGEKTWLEVETQIQGVGEAFKPGLVEVGAMGLAFENLKNSGARGFEAVQSIRDIFVEAKEAGVTNFEQLRQVLAKTFDPADVDAFFKALSQRGVVNIEAGIKLDDRTAGGIVADMQAMGVKFQDTGNKIADATKSVEAGIGDATSAIRDLTNTIRGRPLTSDELPETEEAFATGGIISRPTRALMGEAGPEAVLPLTRRNGRLGVSLHGLSGMGGSGTVINVYAPNAAPGMERTIRTAVLEGNRQTLAAVNRSMARSRRRTT